MTDSRLSTEDLAQPTTARDDVIDLDDSPRADTTDRTDDVPLLDDDAAERFLSRWSDVQTRFVDDPRGAVSDGDGLVAELMQSLAQSFSARKTELEEQWQRGSDPDTEQLRLALQQYRSFFERLLST